CFHCGEPLPPHPATAAIDGHSREFCCEGCAGAAQWIRDADLGDYYVLRSAPAGQVGTESVELSAWDSDDLLPEPAHRVAGGAARRPARWARSRSIFPPGTATTCCTSTCTRSMAAARSPCSPTACAARPAPG